jgi:hypothetical protein
VRRAAAERREVSRRLIDYATRKSLHISMVKSTHAGFRIALLRRGLSMQEVFNHLASLVVEEDPAMVSILDDIEVQKRDRRIKQVTATDAESIFDLIESDLVDVDFDGTGEKEAEDG